MMLHPSNQIHRYVKDLQEALPKGSHESVASDVNVSLKTIARNSVSTDPSYGELSRTLCLRPTSSKVADAFKYVGLDPSLESRRYAVRACGYGVWAILLSTDTSYLLDGYNVLRQWSFNLSKSWIRRIGDYVLIKVSPSKGVVRFGKKGKLAPRFVGPFEVVEKVGHVAYRLRLHEELNGVHDTFHVSNLKKCLADPTPQVPLDEI
ncbi:hypothetical protein Tco_0808579 [Tanacetum coccineum]